MAKIVVLANPSEEEAIVAAMDAAGLKCKVVEPTAANLLHIVIGMVDDGAPAEEPVEEPAPEEASTEEPAPEEASTEEVPDEEMARESIGDCLVDGEKVKIFESKQATSTLVVPNLSVGQRTTYTINESVFAFWPIDTKTLKQRVVLEMMGEKTSAEVELVAGEHPRLIIGSDLRKWFK